MQIERFQNIDDYVARVNSLLMLRSIELTTSATPGPAMPTFSPPLARAFHTTYTGKQVARHRSQRLTLQ